MKKLLTWILIFAMVLSLAACGGSKGAQDAEKSNNSVSGNDPNKLVVLGNARMYDGEDEAWNEMIAAFKEETGITVELRFSGKWNEVPTNLSAAIQAKEQVDFVTVGAGLIRSTCAPAGVLLDITTLVSDEVRQRYTDGMLDAYTIGDKLWGIPFGNSSAGFIYYNVDMFEELGLTPPTTYDEFVQAGKKLEEAGKIPLIFRGKDASYWPNWFFSTYAQTTGNDSIAQTEQWLMGEKSIAGDQAAIDALNAIKAFYDDGILTSESMDTDGDGMKATFMQGLSGMMHTHNFQLTPDAVDFELGILEFPLITDDPNVINQPAGGAGTGLAVCSQINPDNIENAKKFIEFFTRPEWANRISGCYKPTVKVLEGVEILDAEIVTQLNEDLVPNTIMYLDWIWPSEILSAFQSVVPAVVTGAITAEEGTQQLQDAYDTLVREQEYQYDWWNQWTEEDWAKVTP